MSTRIILPEFERYKKRRNEIDECQVNTKVTIGK